MEQLDHDSGLDGLAALAALAGWLIVWDSTMGQRLRDMIALVCICSALTSTNYTETLHAKLSHYTETI